MKKENLKQEFCRFAQGVNKTSAENAENRFERNKLSKQTSITKKAELFFLEKNNCHILRITYESLFYILDMNLEHDFD